MTGILFQGGLFFGSLLLMSAFSFFLTVALEWIGVSVHLSDGLLGIVAAPGADAPEISSAITALSTGHHDLDLGVVLGYNIFDLAALLGPSAIAVGTVPLRKAVALLYWRGGCGAATGSFSSRFIWPSPRQSFGRRASSALRRPPMVRFHRPGTRDRVLSPRKPDAYSRVRRKKIKTSISGGTRIILAGT